MSASSLAPRSRWGAAAGQLAGWGVIAGVNAIEIAKKPVQRSDMAVRAWHHAYDAAELLSLGVVSAAVVMLWQSLLRVERRLLEHAALFSLALGVGSRMLADDFRGFAGERMGDRWAWLGIAVFVMLVALGVPLAAHAGRRLARGRLRLVALAVAVGIALGNNRVVPHDYPGVHFFAAWWAAMLAGTASSVSLARGSPLWLLAPAALSLWSLFVPAPNRVRLELSRMSGAVVAPWLARLELRSSRAVSEVDPGAAAAWFRKRDDLPDIPPSLPRMFAKDAIVLLLVIDAARADLTHPRYAAILPRLTRLRASSVEFTNARAAAPATTLSITSLFTSRYPSQLHWAEVSGRQFPHLDKSVRFSEILQARGVTTLSLQGMLVLRAAYGSLRGFDEESLHDRGASVLVPALCQRLERVGKGAYFAYQHYDDAHSPYTSAGEKPTPFEGYLAGLAVVDFELGRLLDFLDERSLTDRTTVIITADHGEAFGEHDSFFHGTTLYDSLLRVPLIARIPGVPAQRIDQPVTLMDLAPTILDGFGYPTPASYMGQSLVPLIRGQRDGIRRPIVAESDRGHRAILFSDGLKLIVNDELNTLELFDVVRDPAERENLVESQPEVAMGRRALLDSFFDAQRLRR